MICPECKQEGAMSKWTTCQEFYFLSCPNCHHRERIYEDEVKQPLPSEVLRAIHHEANEWYYMILNGKVIANGHKGVEKYYKHHGKESMLEMEIING